MPTTIEHSGTKMSFWQEVVQAWLVVHRLAAREGFRPRG